MINCLDCLRHNAVVRCDYKDCDIGRFRASHTHGRERLVSRRIQESNLLTVNFHHISADMLCNTARLFGRHIRLADCIQK